MNVLILGGGIIGVTSAYYLAREGFNVTIIERQGGPARECSFANGAQLSYSHAEPWANFPNLLKVFKWLGNVDAPLLLRPRWDWDMYVWLIKFLENCMSSSFTNNTRNLLKISFYSRQVLHELLEIEKIKFDYNRSGILHIFKNAHEINSTMKHFALCQKYQSIEDVNVLNHNECIKLDPSLERLMKKRKGGIYCTADESGDAHIFSQEMKKICERLGVKFQFDTVINKFVYKNNNIIGVETNKGLFKAHKYLIALGAYTPKLLKPLGIKLPIYPMKGYTMSVPLNNNSIVPNISITDHEKKVVFTKLRNTLRVGGTVEFAGYDTLISPKRIKPITSITKKFFPDAGDFSKATYWGCLRPQTPKSTPIIGATPIGNLFINSGHGSLGWTQALGSAKLIATIMNGKKPEINMEGLRVEDYI